jgi:predicted GNAT superfamily acetyltransferase
VTSAAVVVRELGTVAELADVVALQRRVWGFGDLDVVPVHLLLTAAHHGGLVLAGYLDQAPVGMLFGFAGLMDDGRPKHCSHMTGVVAEARGKGVGAALKWRQRSLLLERGVDLVTWTFDPLEARNAAFNLRHLGAHAATYLADVYGDLDDDLNRGLPSDRLLVRWPLDDPAVVARAAARDHGARLPVVAPPAVGAAQTVVRTATRAGVRAPVAVSPPEAPNVLVEIPADVQRLKRDAPELARSWRFAVRDALTSAFARGYRAVDVHRGEEHDTTVVWYHLVRQDATR